MERYRKVKPKPKPKSEWAVPEKIQTGEVEDMEFPGALKKKHVEIPQIN